MTKQLDIDTLDFIAAELHERMQEAQTRRDGAWTTEQAECEYTAYLTLRSLALWITHQAAYNAKESAE